VELHYQTETYMVLLYVVCWTSFFCFLLFFSYSFTFIVLIYKEWLKCVPQTPSNKTEISKYPKWRRSEFQVFGFGAGPVESFFVKTEN
jgi:hypothetical protein